MIEKIDGQGLAKKIRTDLTKITQKLSKAPSLVIIRASEDPGSYYYVRAKLKLAKEIGFDAKEIHLENPSYEQIAAEIKKCNNDDNIDGILLQLPLANRNNENNLINQIDPVKDVDGLTSHNLGLLFQNEKSAIIPCTALGVYRMLYEVYQTSDFSGLNAVIFGRSIVVGRSLAMLLVNRNCSVEILHSKSDFSNIDQTISRANIIVSATGYENTLDCSKLCDNTCIIDVGIIRLIQDGKKIIRGDINLINTEQNTNRGIKLSPVPKGVGPMTITMLLINTILLSAIRYKNQEVVDEITKRYYD